MNKLIGQLTRRDIALEILPSFGAALIIAEVYYKFGSFTLECLAFLATWYLLGMFMHWLVSLKK